eukprot:3788123-Rhodomonas_salina.5
MTSQCNCYGVGLVCGFAGQRYSAAVKCSLYGVGVTSCMRFRSAAHSAAVKCSYQVQLPRRTHRNQTQETTSMNGPVGQCLGHAQQQSVCLIALRIRSLSTVHCYLSVPRIAVFCYLAVPLIARESEISQYRRPLPPHIHISQDRTSLVRYRALL